VPFGLFVCGVRGARPNPPAAPAREPGSPAGGLGLGPF